MMIKGSKTQYLISTHLLHSSKLKTGTKNYAAWEGIVKRPNHKAKPGCNERKHQVSSSFRGVGEIGCHKEKAHGGHSGEATFYFLICVEDTLGFCLK